MSLALALSVFAAVALPAQRAYAAPPRVCTFSTSTGTYPLHLTPAQYTALRDLPVGQSIPLEVRGGVVTITKTAAATNQFLGTFLVTYESTTIVQGTLDCSEDAEG